MKANIKSQYYATLEMLERAVNQCPDELWDDPAYTNAVWQVAYHALFYTHLYLQPGETKFSPWAKNRRGYHEMNKKDEAYCKTDILEYVAFLKEQVEKQLDALDLEAPSGFGWLPFNKLELQFYNIRHLQHHTGELCERLGEASDIHVDWVIQSE